MDLRGDAVLGSLAQDSVCVLDCEEALVAEYVHKIRQSFLGNARQHLVAYKVHILALTASVGPSDRMCSKKVRPHGNWGCLLDTSYHTQHLEFVLDSKSVAALDFHGTCTHGHDLAHADHRLLVNFIFRGLVQQVCGVEDSAATCSNLFV